MSSPSSLNVLARYKDYVIANASTVTSVESTIRTLTYLIPGRFQDAELASEVLTSSLNLLGIYHDSILAKAIEKLDKKPKVSVHNRYTKFWTESSQIYKNLSLLVTTIQHLSFLFEIIARKRFGERGRWRTIITIEAVKSICRIILLQETKSRPLVFPHVPEREIDPSVLETSLDEAQIAAELKASKTITSGTQTPTAEIKVQPTQFTSQDAVTDYLLRKVLYPETLKSPKALLHTIRGPAKFAELLYILRPLIYAILLSRSNKSSWRPWLIGLALEYGARELSTTIFQRTHVGGLRALTHLERHELSRRGWSLMWWFLRGAFYENYTKGKIEAGVKKIEGVPLVGMLSTVVRDYEYWWTSYFTTASI